MGVFDAVLKIVAAAGVAGVNRIAADGGSTEGPAVATDGMKVALPLLELAALGIGAPDELDTFASELELVGREADLAGARESDDGFRGS